MAAADPPISQMSKVHGRFSNLWRCVIPVPALKKVCSGLIFVQTGMDLYPRIENRLDCLNRKLAGGKMQNQPDTKITQILITL